MISYFSNNCLSYYIYKKSGLEYNNPLIGSLFLDERHFLKLISNIDYYFKLNPFFGIPKLEENKYYKLNKSIYYQIKLPNYNRKSYPIMILDDVHIHWIHENDEKILLEKYKRRIQRYYNSKPNNIVLISYRDCFCDKEDFLEILNKIKELKIECYLFGPRKFNTYITNSTIKLIEDPIDRDSMERTEYLHYKNHDLDFAIRNVHNYFKKK